MPKALPELRKLARSIARRQATVCVVGLGQIGLITAIMISSSGFKTFGAEINESLVRRLKEGKTEMLEPGIEQALQREVRSGRLVPTTAGDEATRGSNIVVVCVQTPLVEGHPNLSFLRESCATVGKTLTPGKLVSIESSIPPGTIEDIVAPLLRDSSGLRCGLDFWLAHCPERLIPGQALREFARNSRIIGGYDETSREVASKFYERITKGQLILTDSRTAEVVKLAENASRDVEIAFANELAMICERIGVSAQDVIEFANSHPRVKILKPGPGVGGPCLPKDPYLLISSARGGFDSRIMRAARAVNDSMPRHVVELIREGLTEAGTNMQGAKVAILGMAYKGNISDTRESPAKEIVKLLIGEGVRVVTFDPHVKESFGVKRAETLHEALRSMNCAAVLVEHDEFRHLNLKQMASQMTPNPVLIDAIEFVSSKNARKAGFIFRALGDGRNHSATKIK